MDINNKNVQDELQALRVKYINDLPIKITRLWKIWENIKSASSDKSSWEEIITMTHSLAGSGTIFGCPDVSSISREIFESLNAADIQADELDIVLSYNTEKLLNSLEAVSDQYVERHNQIKQPAPAIVDEPVNLITKEKALVYIVDDDTVYSMALTSSITAAGYEAHSFTCSQELHDAVAKRTPDVIILDTGLEEGALAGAGAAENYANNLDIILIFISVRDDIEARLAAIRSGASFYQLKPVSPDKVINILHQFTFSSTLDPFNILIVDDDVELSRLYETHLKAAGMDVFVLNNSVEVIDYISSSAPELIVLDIEMPGINGLELGALIRQYDQYSHIPLVFLSADNSIQTRINSMHLGADDFLAKPITPQLLTDALSARVLRARTMREGRQELQDMMRHLEFVQSALDEHAIVSIADIDGRIIYTNEKFIEVSGYSEHELMGNDHKMLKSGQHDEAFYKDMWDTILSGKTWHGEIVNRSKDGTTYDMYSTIMPKLDEAGLPEQYISIRTNISGLKCLERQVKVEADRLSLALEATDSGMWEWNLENNDVIYSESWRRLLGYRSVDVELSWPKLIHPDDFEDAFYEFMQIASGDSPYYISEHRILNSGGEWEWIREVGKSIKYDSDGIPIRIVGTIQLINRRVELEEQKQVIQTQLLQARKMEAIGHLTAGIAHDFNNLLGGILGYTELTIELMSRNGDVEKMKSYLAEIYLAGNRAKELIAQMLIFSRLTPEESDKEVPVTLMRTVVKEVSSLISSSFPSKIAINYHVGKEDLKAHILPVHLHQMILNLAINARDAFDDYGQIDIILERKTVRQICHSCHEEFSGEYAVLTVKDDGNGIAEENLSNIFEPFFTTKEVGEGSGMGLSVVHGITHSLGGHIGVISEINKGTEFSILLPIVSADEQEASSSIEPRVASEKLVLTGLNIMVVDDEHAMCSMLNELLGMHGASVISFRLSTEALMAFENDPVHYDLVVTDETMPDLSGMDMSKAMMKCRPDIPIILCTGYSEVANSEVTKQIGIADFMQKPLDINKLILMIQKYCSEKTKLVSTG